MSDIKIIWRDFSGALALEAADLLRETSLQSAVVISLFTDRLANADDALPDGSTDRRGWWGDAWPAVTADRLGSRLWLLHREKQVPVVLERAREYASEALQWLVDDGIAQAVTVAASNPLVGVLVLDIKIDRPQGIEYFQYQAAWEAVLHGV